MTGTVTLSDHGQSYVEFDILDDIITDVRPSMQPGWYGTQVKNRAWLPGGRLIIELHNGYRLALQYPILAVTPPPE